jgi:hypothetical protein
LRLFISAPPCGLSWLFLFEQINPKPTLTDNNFISTVEVAYLDAIVDLVQERSVGCIQIRKGKRFGIAPLNRTVPS